ncbi:hypothetical protein BT69DRAFT_1346457 [Atractiella rhizophila]|nr:hypothetical protein BT69DRAFT_1346457 [Atractiella rhizophila]
MSPGPVPLILIGKTAAIAAKVVAGLKPEYEVLHVILSIDEGVAAIHQILRGDAHLITLNNELGTANHSVEPQAVLLGAIYPDEEVKRLRDACHIDGGKQVPSLRVKRIEDLTAEDVKPDSPDYPRAVLKRAKDCLDKMSAEGRLGDNDETVWF